MILFLDRIITCDEKWILYNNSRCSDTIRKLNELSVEVLPHPPYSPDLSTTDYHLFKHFDNFLTGRTFTNQDRQKRPSSNPGHPIFTPTELFDLCYVGKSALIRMVLISIKLNKYSLKYYSLK